MANKTRKGSAEKQITHTRIEDESVIEKTYTFGNKIGAGSFGVVIEAVQINTDQKLAIKIVNKEKAGSSAVKLLEREVGIMKIVKHKYIVHLEEVYETPKKMYLVMEFCGEGDLQHMLNESKTLNEKDTQTVVKRLASAVAYLHKNDIVHRDIKLENILLSKDYENPEDKLNIKLSDFGLSIVKGGVGSDAMMQTMCGTPMYMAPEVINNQGYSQQCDVWSIGVIAYLLISGTPPFTGRDEESLYTAIRKGEVDFTSSVWEGISEEVKNAIQGLTKLDPAHRLTANELLNHPWMLGEKLKGNERTNVLEMMKQMMLEEKEELMNGTKEISDNNNLDESKCDDKKAKDDKPENRRSSTGNIGSPPKRLGVVRTAPTTKPIVTDMSTKMRISASATSAQKVGTNRHRPVVPGSSRSKLSQPSKSTSFKSPSPKVPPNSSNKTKKKSAGPS
ncbi:serine/threonine-protein kinase 33-like [Anneissia japonica]|uniref:serine/threonine-protein kinase 33-like n=1 Tax=Anneissia japonica TaxID=1529436 RepID=UPI00142558D8|nr:serine/threonine-protein kinase 33-like [Anneissia japonica]